MTCIVGLADADSSRSDATGSDQRLSNLLHGVRTRHIAPNFVERRHSTAPRTSTAIADSNYEGPLNPTSTDDVDNITTASMNGCTTTTSSMANPQESFFPAYHNSSISSNTTEPFALTENNFAQHVAATNSSSTMSAPAPGTYPDSFMSLPSSSQYPIAGGYQSQYPQPTDYTGWGAPQTTSSQPNPFMQDITQTNNFGQMLPPTVQQPQMHAHGLPNLSHLLQMRTPLQMPLLDEPENGIYQDNRSDGSLSSPCESTLKSTFSVGNG